MYFTSLPDHNAPGFDEAGHFNRFRQQNMVFNAISDKSRCDRHVGCLSLKTVYGGEEWYGVGKRMLPLREGQLLVLNDEQEYSCRIDTTGQVRVQSVFFHKAFAAEAFFDAISNEEKLLDNPFEKAADMPEFHQALHQTSPLLERQLQHLMGSLNELGYNRNMVDEQLLFLLQRLIELHKTEASVSNRVDAVKPSTKTELFKRLCIARDFVQASFMDNPCLAAIGGAACLSLPQLVRQFKTVFHETPHQYLVGVKLSNAARLLQRTGAPVQDVAWQCGFEDTSAFCRAFKKRYGVPPLSYKAARRQN